MTFTQAIEVINGMISNFPENSNTAESFEALEIARDTMERVQANIVRLRMQQRKEKRHG